MKNLTPIEGKRFGRLVVLKNTGEKDKFGRYLYLCKCDCGNLKKTTRTMLLSGQCKSCGCYRKYRPSRFTHLMSKTREYRIWGSMVKRCTNPKTKCFPYYGGRGITICDRWRRFENFFEDMGKCPEGYSLDRIDTNGNYEPSNCRWVSLKTQSRNRRNNHLVTFNGETHCLSEWAEKLGMPYDALKNRLRRGWSIERAFSEEVKS